MPDNPLILAVDRNERNLELLAQYLGKEGYEIFKAASFEAFEQALAHSKEIELALVDIAGFDRRVWECCVCEALAKPSPTSGKHSFSGAIA